MTRKTTEENRATLRASIKQLLNNDSSNSIDRALQRYVQSGVMEAHGIADIRAALIKITQRTYNAAERRSVEAMFDTLRAYGLNTGADLPDGAIKTAHVKLDQFEEWGGINQAHIDVLRAGLNAGSDYQAALVESQAIADLRAGARGVGA